MNTKKLEWRLELSGEANWIYLKGELDLSTAEEFRSIIEPLAQQADKALRLNVQELRYVDSTGLGILISILKMRDAMNAEFSIEEVPPKIKRLFDITGLSKFLPESTQSNT